MLPWHEYRNLKSILWMKQILDFYMEEDEMGR